MANFVDPSGLSSSHYLSTLAYSQVPRNPVSTTPVVAWAPSRSRYSTGVDITNGPPAYDGPRPLPASYLGGR